MATITTLIANLVSENYDSYDYFISFLMGVLVECKEEPEKNRNLLSASNFRLMRQFYGKAEKTIKKEEILDLLGKIRKEIGMPESYAFLSDSEIEAQIKERENELFDKIKIVSREEEVEELMNNFLSDPSCNYDLESLKKIHELVMKLEHPEKVTLKRRKNWTRNSCGAVTTRVFGNWVEANLGIPNFVNNVWGMFDEIRCKLELVDEYRISSFLRVPSLEGFRKIHKPLMDLDSNEITLKKEDWEIGGSLSSWIVDLPDRDRKECSKMINEIRKKFFSNPEEEVERRMNQFFLDGSFSSSEFNEIHDLVMKMEKPKWIGFFPSAKMIWGNGILSGSIAFLQQVDFKKLDGILDKIGRRFFEVTKEEELRFRMDYFLVPNMFHKFQNLKSISEIVSSFEGQLPLISLDGWRTGEKIEDVFLSPPFYVGTGTETRETAMNYLRIIRRKFDLISNQEKKKEIPSKIEQIVNPPSNIEKKEIMTENDHKLFISYILVDGLMDGSYIEYWPHTNIVRLEGNHSRGMKQGRWTIRNKAGIVVAVQNFKDDKVDGDQHLYDEKGNLTSFSQFSGGVQNGISRSYPDDDQRTKSCFHVQGQLKNKCMI
jgi:hypothetical protein